MNEIWTQEDYAEYERQRALIKQHYAWLEQERIDRWAAHIVNLQKQL